MLGCKEVPSSNFLDFASRISRSAFGSYLWRCYT